MIILLSPPQRQVVGKHKHCGNGLRKYSDESINENEVERDEGSSNYEDSSRSNVFKLKYLDGTANHDSSEVLIEQSKFSHDYSPRGRWGKDLKLKHLDGSTNGEIDKEEESSATEDSTDVSENVSSLDQTACQKPDLVHLNSGERQRATTQPSNRGGGNVFKLKYLEESTNGEVNINEEFPITENSISIAEAILEALSSKQTDFPGRTPRTSSRKLKGPSIGENASTKTTAPRQSLSRSRSYRVQKKEPRLLVRAASCRALPKSMDDREDTKVPIAFAKHENKVEAPLQKEKQLGDPTTEQTVRSLSDTKIRKCDGGTTSTAHVPKSSESIGENASTKRTAPIQSLSRSRSYRIQKNAPRLLVRAASCRALPKPMEDREDTKVPIAFANLENNLSDTKIRKCDGGTRSTTHVPKSSEDKEPGLTAHSAMTCRERDIRCKSLLKSSSSEKRTSSSKTTSRRMMMIRSCSETALSCSFDSIGSGNSNTNSCKSIGSKSGKHRSSKTKSSRSAVGPQSQTPVRKRPTDTLSSSDVSTKRMENSKLNPHLSYFLERSRGRESRTTSSRSLGANLDDEDSCFRTRAVTEYYRILRETNDSSHNERSLKDFLNGNKTSCLDDITTKILEP